MNINIGYNVKKTGMFSKKKIFVLNDKYSDKVTD